MSRRHLKCEYCHVAQNQFVHDTQRDELICTLCGVLVRNFRFGTILGGACSSAAAPDSAIPSYPNPLTQAISYRYASYGDASYTSCAQTSNSAKPHIRAKVKRGNRGLTTESANTRLLDRVFRDDVTARRINAKLRRYSDLMGVNDRVHTRAGSLISKFPQMYKDKSIDSMIVATLVLVNNSLGLPVNLKDVENDTSVTKLSKAIAKLCKVTNISLKSMVVKSLPYTCTFLGLAFKDQKKIERDFARFTRENGSIGSYTLLALTLYNYLGREKARLDDIAYITNTSKVSLLNYIDGRKKSTVFAKPE